MASAPGSDEAGNAPTLGISVGNTAEAWSDLLGRLHREALGNGSITVRNELRGGRSGAQTLVVDLLADPSASADLDGQYVLKLDELRHWEGEASQPEADRHQRVLNEASAFAEEHIPRVVWSSQSGDKTAVLYELAGQRQLGLSPANAMDSGALSRVLSELSRNLLTGLAAPTVQQSTPAPKLVAHWLGYRLDPLRGERLHQRVGGLAGSESVWISAGDVLPNPLWFCKHPSLAEHQHAVFQGLRHGDLHLGNVLASAATRPIRWWLGGVPASG